MSRLLTAHTITDDAIRALARTALTASQHRDCTIALGPRREMLTSIAGKLARYYPTTRDRRAARARCAELVNAGALAGRRTMRRPYTVIYSRTQREPS